MPHMKIRLTLPIVFAFAFPHLIMPAQAQLVPGTGQQIIEVFDDFEDPTWAFTLNLPKASANLDKTERHPSGFSNNRLYLESLYRGTPDFVHRVETPPGGIPGSKGALALQTLNSGVPGRYSYEFQQDDLIAGVQQKLGYMMPVSWSPSYVCRVYVPPFDKWERRHGSHFGFRADCTTTIDKPTAVGRFFKSMKTTKKLEQYWPGFFIQLNMKEKTGQKEDSAVLLIRGDHLGHEVPGPKITHEGWWTLGLSFTPDGRVHYYAHEGVENLTAKDHIYSGFPYGYHCEQTSTFFFNIVNQDDGRTWSTRWIVDDPKVYVASGTYRPPVQPQVVQTPKPAPAPVPATAATPTVPTATTPPVIAAQPNPTPAVQAPKPMVATPTTTPSVSVPRIATKPEDIPLSPPPYSAPKPVAVPKPAAESVPQVKPEAPTPVPVVPMPVSPTPAASAPEVPKVEVPTVEVPKVETPKVETPKVETPKVETPKVETPKVETPKVEAPKVEPPKTEVPKAEPPTADVPKFEPPIIVEEQPSLESPPTLEAPPALEVPTLPTPSPVPVKPE